MNQLITYKNQRKVLLSITIKSFSFQCNQKTQQLINQIIRTIIQFNRKDNSRIVLNYSCFSLDKAVY